MTIEEIRAKAKDSDDLQREKVHVNKWGIDIWIWEMALDARDEFDVWSAEVRRKDDYTAFRTRLVVETARDDNGERIFTLDDECWLRKKSAVRYLSSVALRLNRMRQQDVEDGEKNSEGATEGSSLSA